MIFYYIRFYHLVNSTDTAVGFPVQPPVHLELYTHLITSPRQRANLSNWIREVQGNRQGIRELPTNYNLDPVLTKIVNLFHALLAAAKVGKQFEPLNHLVNY